MAALKGLLVAGVSLGVIGVGGYLGDTAVRAAAENRVAGALTTALRPTGPPEVELGGVPFSLALLTRTVPDAHLRVDGLPVDMAGHSVTLRDVSVSATQVSLADTQVVLGSADGEARLSYDDLSAVASVPVGYGEPGRLQVSYTVTVFSRELTASVSAVPELDTATQQLRLADPTMSIAGFDLGADVLQGLVDAVVEPIDLSLLPYGIQLTAITPTPQGLDLTATGNQLTIPLA